MIRRLLAVLLLCASAFGATEYFISNSGDDLNPGTYAAPWKTLGSVSTGGVHASLVVPGTTIYLLRGDTWNEPLVPATSGTSGSHIYYDSYDMNGGQPHRGGSGPAPRITGYQLLTGNTWAQVLGPIYKTDLSTAPAVTTCSTNYANVLFNGVPGKNFGSSSLSHDRDFYCNSGQIYVYAPNNNPNFYYKSIVAITPSGATNALIDVNGKSYLEFQHIQLDYFDTYGAYVHGAASNLIFANMTASSGIVGGYAASVSGSLPYGFYVATGTNPTTINFYNVDAHLNYDGFRLDSYGAGSQITLTGCRGFANRDAGIFDNTAGTGITYSYSHFYANGISSIESTDVIGSGIAAGAGNIPANTTPVTQDLDRFPAIFSFTVDDVGLSAGTEGYIDKLVPVFDAHGVKMNMAATAGFSPDATEMANWLADGHEIDSHSWSHQYYTSTGGYGGPAVLNIEYGPVNSRPAATGTAATLSISGGVLSTHVTGASGQDLTINFSSYPTLQDVLNYINTRFGNVYTVSAATTRPDSPIHMGTLAAVSNQDIKSASYTALFDVTAFWTDELTSSKSWLESHVPGLTVPVYVYPGGWNTAQSDTLAASAGYVGARGQISMHPPGSTSGALKSAGDLLPTGRGVDIYNIISLSPSIWHGLTQQQMDAKMAALVFKAKAWGLPIGLFAHNVDVPALTAQDVEWIINAITSRHGQIRTNSQIIAYLTAGPVIPTTTQYIPAPSAPMPLLRTASISPDSATKLSQEPPLQGNIYLSDMLGQPRSSSSNWDIGAYLSATWGAQHGSKGTTQTAFYGKPFNTSFTSENAYCLPGDAAMFGASDGPATLPQQCTYTAMSATPSPGTVRTATSCSDIETQLAAVANNSGDTVVIPAALGKCIGTWSVGYKGDASHWLTIRTDQIANAAFPGEGMRSSPCQINIAQIDGYPDYACSAPAVLVPTLSSNASNQSALNVTGDHVRVIGVAFTKEATTSMMNSLVSLTGSDHVILDRVLIHGADWSSYDYSHSTKAGLTPKGTYQALINSWVYDIDYNSADGQCISGGTGTQTDEGPLKIYNNLLACSSETWLFGGGAAVAWPHDIEIRRNISMKPLKWMAPLGAATFVGANSAWPNVKNLGEFKHGHRVLYEENVAIHSWEGQSDQVGNGWLFLPKNQNRTTSAKFVNTNGTAISCASDASGTPCAANTGVWANRITTLSRTNGIVTLNGTTDGGWPYWNANDHAVIQGIQSQVVNGVNMNSFNGEIAFGCSPTACTDGFNHPDVAYFASAGPDFGTTTVTGGLIQDYTASTCASTGHCGFSAPSASYPNNYIASVIDSEHVTVLQDEGVQTGATQSTCHPGAAPQAQVQDMTLRYNYMSHVENLGITLSNAVSNCLDVTQGVSNFSIHDNVFDDIDTVAWDRGTNTCCGHGGGGIGIWNSAPNPPGKNVQAANFTIAHNTFASQRGWPSPSTEAGSSIGFGDGYDVAYTGTTVQRISNVVTITFGSLSGVNQALKTIITGFTGSYADINGTWPITLQTGTTMTFTETGSHSDISPAITISSGTTGQAYVSFPHSYYANAVWRDNIGPGWSASKWNGSAASGGTSAALAAEMCDPITTVCTWTLKNNLIITGAGWAGYNAPGYTSPFPTTNPDSSPTCTLTGGCFPANFSGIFANWNQGVGDTHANDYTVTANYKGVGSDGKDLGADITRWKALLSTLYPTFTYAPLAITTTSLTACSNGVYCEQQLAWSGGASPFVQWHITSGTLPTGISLANGDGVSTCKVNGSYSKTGPTGCAGWIWGTPTQTGTFPLTFQAEDAAHQKATVSLTLTVN